MTDYCIERYPEPDSSGDTALQVFYNAFFPENEQEVMEYMRHMSNSEAEAVEATARYELILHVARCASSSLVELKEVISKE